MKSSAFKVAPLLLTNIFLLIGCTLHSQSFSYRQYTSESGLASSNVYVAFQDSKGYIWFGTDEGVSRFDGKLFVNYTSQHGLADNDILRIYEDTFGRIWFLSFNGHLSYFSLIDNKIHNSNTDPFLSKTYPGSSIYYAMQDLKGRLWFCTLTGKIVLLEGTKATVITVPGKHIPYIVCVDEDAKNRIIVYHVTDRLVYDEVTHTLVAEGTGQGARSTYFHAPSSNIYFTTTTHLYSINKGQFKQFFPLANFNFSSYEIVTATDDGHYIYLATLSNGVIVLDPKNNYKVVRKYSFKSIVYSVTIDKENNIWFLTRDAGAYMLPVQNRNTELLSSGIFNNNDLYSIVQKDSGSLLIGGNQNNLFSVKNKSIHEISLLKQENKYPCKIIELKTDQQKNTWIASELGLYKLLANYNYSVNKTTNIEFDNFFVRVLDVDINSKGTVCYALSTGIREVVPLKDEKYTTKIPFNGIFENKRTYSVFYDNCDNLFIANIKGLNEVRKDTIISYEGLNKKFSARIIHITQTKDSTLILSTDGNGIIFFKNGKIINYFNTQNGLASSVCRKTVCYGNTVYVCTSKGLTSFSYENNKISSVQNITNFNGLVSNDVRDVLLLSNRLYIVTVKGVCLINRQTTPLIQAPPPVYITSIVGINNTELNPDSIALTYNNNFLKVKFTAVTFSNPANASYQYSLGNSANWINCGTDEVAFSDLSPGNYHLSVRAKSIHSTWSAPATLQFRIIPPFYKTWWFAAVAVVTGVLVLIMLLINWYRRKQRALFIELDKINMLNLERNRISADMHDDVGSDLSKIYVTTEFIKTQLGEHHTLFNQLQKLNSFTSGARKKMDDIIWALNPENDNLGNLIAYINTYALNYFSDTQVNFHLQNNIGNLNVQLNAKERRNIFLIIKEICTNTLKHAGAHHFTISFSLSESQIIINTQDDGMGMSPETPPKSGNGMKNIKKRTTEIKGNFSVNTNLNKGTAFTIIIPV